MTKKFYSFVLCVLLFSFINMSTRARLITIDDTELGERLIWVNIQVAVLFYCW